MSTTSRHQPLTPTDVAATLQHHRNGGGTVDVHADLTVTLLADIAHHLGAIATHLTDNHTAEGDSDV